MSASRRAHASHAVSHELHARFSGASCRSCDFRQGGESSRTRLSTTRRCVLTRFNRGRVAARNEPDAHAGLGQEVTGPGGVGLELVPELGHELTEVVGLAHVLGPQTSSSSCRWPTSRSGLPTRISTRCHCVGVSRISSAVRPPVRLTTRSMRKSGRLDYGSRSSPGLARRSAARRRASSSPMLNGFVDVVVGARHRGR